MKKKILIGGLFLGIGILFIKKILPMLNSNTNINPTIDNKPSSELLEKFVPKKYDVKEWKDPNKLTRREYIDKYY
tara:strand:+ start:50 stop:274 length:225 start_codon:yes stop_codon:yes gene_type:complete